MRDSLTITTSSGITSAPANNQFKIPSNYITYFLNKSHNNQKNMAKIMSASKA